MHDKDTTSIHIFLTILHIAKNPPIRSTLNFYEKLTVC